MARRLALALLLLAALEARAAETTPRVFVLDWGAHSLAAVDLASGKRTATLSLAGNPTWLVQSDDGRYLVALDYGPGENKGDRGYKATGRSSATVVDAARLSVIGHVELGFGLDSVLAGADGRLTVTCPGYDAKDPRERLARELVVVDLATARETGRMALEPGTDLTWRSADGRTLALLQGLPRTAKYPYPNSRITLVDVAAASVVRTLDASGWDRAERDADYLYLIRFGKPDKNPAKNENGSIDVVSLAEGRVERLDAGRDPQAGILHAEGLMAIASEGPPDATAGELRLVRGGKLAATLEVARSPMWVGSVAGEIYVVGGKAVTLVDPVKLSVTASIPLDTGGAEVVDDDDRPFEVVAAKDGRRAFIHYPAQERVAVLDLERKKAIGSTKTGRGGKKILNSMLDTLSYGVTSRVYFYNPGDPPQLLARPDGRFAYALNRATSDVTIVDADTAAAVAKIGAGGGALTLLGESTLVILGPELNRIDTSRNAKLDPLRFPGLVDFQRSPDGAFAVVLAERTLAILDGATGTERARLVDFVQPARLAFAKAAASAVEPTEP